MTRRQPGSRPRESSRGLCLLFFFPPSPASGPSPRAPDFPLQRPRRPLLSRAGARPPAGASLEPLPPPGPPRFLAEPGRPAGPGAWAPGAALRRPPLPAPGALGPGPGRAERRALPTRRRQPPPGPPAPFENQPSPPSTVREDRRRHRGQGPAPCSVRG